MSSKSVEAWSRGTLGTLEEKSYSKQSPRRRPGLAGMGVRVWTSLTAGVH